MSSTETLKKSPRNSDGPILPTRLAHALSAIAQTLPNPWDESTDYFVPFAAALDASQPTNADSLRQVLDVGGHFQLDLAAVDLTATGARFGDDTLAKGFALLDVVMKATLSDITRVIARAPGATLRCVTYCQRQPGPHTWMPFSSPPQVSTTLGT